MMTEEQMPSENQPMLNETSNHQEGDTEENALERGDDEMPVEKVSDSLEEILREISKGIETDGESRKNLSGRVAQFKKQWEKEFKAKKKVFLAEGGIDEDFEFKHRIKQEFDELFAKYKQIQVAETEKANAEQLKNLANRAEILERLKSLYSNAKPGTNLFKEIRKIKEDWNHAGFVPHSEFIRLQQDYHFHLDQFYAMLDLNQEYREQEYGHNLEKRHSIIARVKELIEEPIVQKALNELQFLHRMWKEEAVPVAEEFRESTWQEFRDLSDKVLERKKELYEHLEKEHQENLERKNAIISKLKELATAHEKQSHATWKAAMKKVEELRNEFVKLGKVPKGEAHKNWDEFKKALRAFNSAKNNFYKELKKEQFENLEKKLNLIQTAKDNQNSEDWATVLPFFKEIQAQWKAIGHVPRNRTDAIWKEFQEVCNHFFENYRKNNPRESDDWQRNYDAKKELLEALKEIGKSPDSAKKINEIKNKWNAIGKVPRNKMEINREFQKTLQQKMSSNEMSLYELEDSQLSERRTTDKARKIKKQIADLETEVANLENNLSFFKNPSPGNIMLKDTFENLETKKNELQNLREALHQMIEEAEENAKK